jgi:hypothetical protein
MAPKDSFYVARDHDSFGSVDASPFTPSHQNEAMDPFFFRNFLKR